MDQGFDRGEFEKEIRSRLSDYGIEARKIYVDREMSTVIVLCAHITSHMKLFLSDGAASLGGIARDTMISAHRAKIAGEQFGLLVIYCKKCFGDGLKLLLGGD